MQIMRTRFDVPAGIDALIVRPRLLHRLGDVTRSRLTVVHSPAGYGKSSLLGQWHGELRKTGYKAIWLAIDPTDHHAMCLMSYVSAALSHFGVLNEPSPEQLDTANLFGSVESLTALVVNELDRHDGSIFFFIDDAHLLGKEAALALTRLIERAPSKTRFIVAARSVQLLQLARIRARGQMFEIGPDNLRFTQQETSEFMTACAATTLDEKTLHLLDQKTEGWIAGIRLASLVLRRTGSMAELLPTFSGGRRDISDFFAEEVLATQPEALRQFMLRTSILDRLSPALCEAVTGQEQAKRLLDSIEGCGAFMLQLDGERQWSRYHHLFSEFLRHRLDDEHPGLATQLHLRASAWYWQEGLQVESIEHALKAKDFLHAAALLEECSQDFTYTGRIPLVRKFAAQIPDAVLKDYPRVLLTLAWVHTRNLRFEETRELLAIVDRRLLELEQAGSLDKAELRQLRYLRLHREMVLSTAEDKVQLAEQQCQHLLDEYTDQRNSYLRGTLYATLLYARREQYQLNDIERLQATAQGILSRSGNRFASIALEASIGPSLFFAGKTDTAIRVLEQAVEAASAYGGRNSSLSALPALPLSEIVYESNDLDRAESLVKDTLPYATEFGFVDQLMPGFITQARVRRARGDHGGAERALDEAMTLAIERNLERLQWAVVAERVKYLIQDGKPDQAARCLETAGGGGSAKAHLPSGDVTTRHELRAVAWVRVAQSEDRVADALTVIKHWRSFCSARGAMRSLLQWDLLLSQVLFVSGDLRAAQRALREAIAHAASSRCIRSFIDEGATIRSLLKVTYEGDLEVLHPTDAFASELLEAFERPGYVRPASTHPARAGLAPVHTLAEGLYGKLSAKEREILSLVSSGMRNREVARKLGMTEGSVKWYMQQVYDKVGTRRRLQAVERARQFGLIA